MALCLACPQQESSGEYNHNQAPVSKANIFNGYNQQQLLQLVSRQPLDYTPSAAIR